MIANKSLSFKNKMILLLIGAVIMTALLIGAIQYCLLTQHYELMDIQRQALIEDNMIKLMSATDYAYRMVEEPIEMKSRTVLSKVLEAYEQKGIEQLDLREFYDPKENMDIYVIDSRNVVIDATYKKDIGLDFNNYSGVPEFFDTIRGNGSFSSDRLSLSSIENIVTKYCYLPTVDGKYIFETSKRIDKELVLPEELSLGKFGEIITERQPFVLSVMLFSKYGVTFDENPSEAVHINPDYEPYYIKSLEKLKPVTFEGIYKGEKATVKYLPFEFSGAGDLHKQTVIEIVYSKDDLIQNRRRMMFFGALSILISGSLVAIYAVFRSKALLAPLMSINSGIQRVASGNYETEINLDTRDEFEVIANHFNSMITMINAEIIKKQEKEEEISAQKEKIESLYAQAAEINNQLKALIESNKKSYFETIKALANAEEEKDAYTRGHCDRVMDYSMRIAGAIGFTSEEIENLKYGAILHDIGKIGVPEHILNKCSMLTQEELVVIREHPAMGARILKDLAFMKNSIRIIYEHHEWYNGEGYPSGLKGEDICKLARVVCIADAFDAMTTQRPYRIIAMTKEEAIQELKDKRGTQFDPEFVDVFISLLDGDQDMT